MPSRPAATMASGDDSISAVRKSRVRSSSMAVARSSVTSRKLTSAAFASRNSDENEIGFWDDQGDSAGFGDTLMNSVMFRYAVTGTEADYQRFESWLRGQVMKFDATGMDGYLARWVYGKVPGGTQIKNGYAMDYGNDFAIPAGVKKIPTAIDSLATAAVADANPI